MNNSQNTKQKEKEWRGIKESDIIKLNTKPKINGCINCKYEEKSSSVDTNWLFRRLLHYLEFEMKVEEKERFANMKGGDFAHALMMVYGAYLINASETGKKVIIDD